MGPRIKTRSGNILKGKTHIPPNCVFNVDTENKNVNVNVEGSLYYIGNELVYISQSLEN